jgi:RNA polymerase sigma-70 factor, ECF subfamily
MPERGPGDPGRLFETYGHALYRYAVMLLADASAAEDAVQQVFMALLRQRGPIENQAHYLRRAVRNEWYSMLRARKVRGDARSDRRLLEAAADAPVAPDERIALERAIQELPPEQREVIHLHVFEGWTFQQIADASSDSINTIAGRYRYALAKLRQTLTSL